MKEQQPRLSEAQERYNALPLSVKSYFIWEKEKRIEGITLEEKARLVELQEEVKSKWNIEEKAQFLSYVDFQTKEIVKRGVINNGRKPQQPNP